MSEVRSSAKDGALSRERVREGLLFVGVFVFTLVAAYVLLGLAGADFRVLWRNSWDARAAAMGVKGFIDHGSWVTNPQVGAPGGLNTLDFPSADFLNVVLLSIIGLIVRQAALAVNLYYLLGYPLAALTAAIVLRRFRLSRAASALAAILFAFIPYHYLRGTAHLFLSEYWIVPLVFLLALQLDQRRPPFFSTAEKGDTLELDIHWRSALMPALIAVGIGTCGVYYAFFALFFIALAGAYAAVHRRSFARLYSAGGLVGIIVATLFVQWVPALLYRMSNGFNPGAVARASAEADAYSLRLSQLLLPGIGHRIESLSLWSRAYWESFFGVSKLGLVETYYATLGVLAAIGVVTLLIWPLLAGIRTSGEAVSRTRAIMNPLSIFAWGGLLFGTAGGIGAIVGIFFSLIRCYNRVSIFLAFLALFALGLLIDLVAERFGGGEGGGLIAVWVICAVLLGVGLFDQVVPAQLPDYGALALQEASDAQIVGAVEAKLPKDAMVFQLPYIPFPEGGTLEVWPANMVDYGHFRAPLQSASLRWSYGTMKGRPGDKWYRSTAGLSADKMVAELKAKGFSAIWVDRNGYSDGGKEIESQFQSATGSAPLVSLDDEISVFIIK
jgi:phosphoglycerol transferase